MGFFNINRELLLELKVKKDDGKEKEMDDKGYSLGDEGKEETTDDTATDDTEKNTNDTEDTATDDATDKDTTEKNGYSLGDDATDTTDDTSEEEDTTNDAADDTSDEYSLKDTDVENDTSGEEDATNDNVEDTGDETTDDTTTDDGSSEEDGYSLGDDATDTTDDGSGEEDTTDDTVDDTAGGQSEVQSMEGDLFKDLSPEQMAIKNEELKQRYIDVYESVDNIMARVNKMSKSTEIIKVAEFITNKLLELKQMCYYYLTNTFDTKSYIENSINYQQYLAVIDTVNKIFEQINTEKK